MSRLDEIIASETDFAAFSSRYFDRLHSLLQGLEADDLRALAAAFEAARQNGNTIFVVGNGGSATTATSMANDLGFDILKKTGTERCFRVLALTDSNAVVTAIANDVGYEGIFTNQLRVHFRPGDCLLVISASGNSPNTVKAAEWVRERGGTVIGFLGFTGGRLLDLCDVVLHVKAEFGEYGPVEDAHLVLNHLLAHWFQVKLRVNS